MSQSENHFHPLWNVNVFIKIPIKCFTVIVTCFELNVNAEKLWILLIIQIWKVTSQKVFWFFLYSNPGIWFLKTFSVFIENIIQNIHWLKFINNRRLPMLRKFVLGWSYLFLWSCLARTIWGALPPGEGKCFIWLPVWWPGLPVQFYTSPMLPTLTFEGCPFKSPRTTVPHGVQWWLFFLLTNYLYSWLLSKLETSSMCFAYYKMTQDNFTSNIKGRHVKNPQII